MTHHTLQEARQDDYEPSGECEYCGAIDCRHKNGKCLIGAIKTIPEILEKAIQDLKFKSVDELSVDVMKFTLLVMQSAAKYFKGK